MWTNSFIHMNQGKKRGVSGNTCRPGRNTQTPTALPLEACYRLNAIDSSKPKPIPCYLTGADCVEQGLATPVMPEPPAAQSSPPSSLADDPPDGLALWIS